MIHPRALTQPRALIKPKALRPGGMLGIVSPASAVPANLVGRGIAELERLGYRTKVFPHALSRGRLNYAGSLADRVSDLHAAFADAEVDGIVCTRGGWGSAELLPHLDAGLIAANAKVFAGYSDITTLHLWLQRKVGLVSFQAPMVASDFAKGDVGMDAASWQAALGQSEPWSVGAEAGLRVLRPGTAEGVLGGGCMSIYAEAIGTAYAPGAERGVLFLEDVGTHAYQWDRMLLHLRYAGLLDGVTGVVFGDMGQCCAAEEMQVMEETLLYGLRDFDGPLGIGLRSGHVAGGNVTLPMGVRVRLELADAANPQMHFVEGAVRD
jgi:muramoyltetrapeptide carboxypeptidase